MLSACLNLRIILAMLLLSGPRVALGAGDSVEALQADQKFFTDPSCCQLKKGVKPRDLVAFRSEVLKSAAGGMLDGSYDRAYRAASYQAYPSPRELGRTLKLGEGFSRYENITGIYLPAGEHVVLVGKTAGKELSLLIPDWMRKPAEGIKPTEDPAGWGLQRQEIGLKEGVNVIRVEKGGNAYVSYFGDRGVMRLVADPSVVIKGDPCWGFCHETGHVLQMIPQMTWGGMTKVSCNLFSMYTVGGMGNESRLKAQGNYASARKNIVEREPKGSYLACPDVFDRLVPFWQLHLYFSRNGRPDFYADVMERMRGRPDAGTGNDSIRNQFEFVKLCCDVGRLDLTDFFDKWGFFWVGTLTVDDYGKFSYTITQEMVDETRSYIAKKRYRKPSADLTLIEE